MATPLSLDPHAYCHRGFPVSGDGGSVTSQTGVEPALQIPAFEAPEEAHGQRWGREGRGGQNGLPGLSQQTSPCILCPESTSGPWERGGRGGSSQGAGVEGTWVGAGLDVPPLGGKTGWVAPWASLSLNFRGCAAPLVHPAGSCLSEENVPEGTGQAGAVRETSFLRSLLLTTRGLESRAHHCLLSPPSGGHIRTFGCGVWAPWCTSAWGLRAWRPCHLLRCAAVSQGRLAS